MSLMDSLLSVIAPHACLVCGREGGLLCVWSLPDAFLPVPSRCYRCKRLSQDFATCSACRSKTPLCHVFVRTDYAQTAKKLVYALKFNRAQAGAPIIAGAMLDSLPHVSANTLICPVPTATGRVRQRGYDQAVLLARDISKQRNLMCQRSLVRLTQSRQVGANRQKRLQQLEGAFYVPHPGNIKGKDILLVDDVITTGATLETAARVLKRAGAKAVSALAFAYKQ